MSEETFLGYCFDDDGYHYPAVTLRNIEEVFSYIDLHRSHFPEIRITDIADELVLHVIKGVIVWPVQSEVD